MLVLTGGCGLGKREGGCGLGGGVVGDDYDSWEGER